MIDVTHYVSGQLTGLIKRTDEITQHFVFNGYAGLVSHYKSLIISLVVIAIALIGWGVLNGWFRLSVSELSKRTLTIGMVLSLSLHWDVFCEYIYNVFTLSPNEIGSTLIRSMGGLKSGSDLNGTLELLLNQGIDLSVATYKSTGVMNWAPLIYGTLIFMMTILLGGLVLVELIAAKFGLAVFLVLAPLVIPLCLFKPAKEAIFDGWFKHLITFAFIPVFISATSALIILLLQDTIGDAHQVIGLQALDINILIPYLIGSIVCVGLLWRVSHLASSIAGGISATVSQGFGNLMLNRMLSRASREKNNQNKTATKTKNSATNDTTP